MEQNEAYLFRGSLVPFDAALTSYVQNFSEEAKYVGTYTKPTAFRKLILGEGTSITVNGVMSVSGRHCYAGGATGVDCTPSGPQGMIEMAGNSHITINGTLYAWGYIYGSGRVTANSTATVYELLQVLDFRGGTVTKELTGNNKGIFPFSQFYVQNVEVPLTYHCGAKAYALVTVSATAELSRTLDFLGTSKCLFSLSNGTATKYYDGSSDRFIMELDGDASISSVSIDFGILASFVGLNSIHSENFVLPLGSNYTIRFLSGTASINQDLAMLPGSILEVHENAKIQLAEGRCVYIYDAEQWNADYVFKGGRFAPIKYSPTKTYSRTVEDLVDVAIMVNGTIDSSAGSFYTTEGGANIYSTGAGRVIVGDVASSSVNQYIQGTSTYVEIPVNSAWLKNANPAKQFTETSGASNTTYYYCLHCGMWKTDNTHSHTGWLTNVSLSNNLHMYFAYQTDLEAGNLTASVTHYYADGSAVTTDGYTLEQGTINGNQYLRLTYTGVAAKEMVDAVYVTLYDSTGKAVAFWGDSIRDYAERLYDLNTTSDKLKTVIVNMLNYGAACQVQFQYNTSNLANNRLESSLIKEYVQKPGNALNNDPAASSITIAQRNLEVTSSIRFHIAFNGNVAGKTATVTLTGHKGNPIRQTPTVDSNGCIEITDLVVADYDCEITITIDGTTMKTKISHYLNDLGGTDTDNVFYAFMEFAASAYDYLHTRGGTQ